MPWYKTGTVSVTQNSNAVIGSGTAFISNARVGDGFRGPDGGWYEVTNIASDTALSISPSYQGVTNNAGVYALAPMQGYVKDSADALRALVNQYGAKLAALGTTGNYEILPPSKGGTGITDLSVFIQGMLNDADDASARATLGAAKSGANNDITALTALTTAVPVTMGGTGGKTQAAARTGLGLGSAAVAALVGTVSQSGGVPTGAIIERGSVATGNYTKFADGTMICTYKHAVIRTINIATGALFFAAAETAKPFPQAFIAEPAINIFGSLENGEGFVITQHIASNTSWPVCYMLSQISRPAQILYFDYVAIGRWF